MSTQAEWVTWLAKTGAGVDYAFRPDPPCSLQDLAEAYLLTDYGSGIEDDTDTTGDPAWKLMAWVIQQETGMFASEVVVFE